MLQLHSLLKSAGELEIYLAKLPLPELKADELLVRVQAAPINPSDLALLIGPGDVTQAKITGSGDETRVTMPAPTAGDKKFALRVDKPQPVGNEGAGVVEKAGSSPEAQALLGKTVAVLGGSMYATHRVAKVAEVLPMPAGLTAKEAAAPFVNPLTVLSMLIQMRIDGHTALVHTAAASNLGQMLVRHCKNEGVELVNVVRSEEQVKLLKDLGAVHVLNSTLPTFHADLVAAITTTRATCCFDATGGGTLASQILNAMEEALSKDASSYSRYGSMTPKQVFIYGMLDTSPTVLHRPGFSWGVSGWLFSVHVWAKLPRDQQLAGCTKVANELKTTFSSKYEMEVGLVEMLQPDVMLTYARKATGKKYLLCIDKK